MEKLHFIYLTAIHHFTSLTYTIIAVLIVFLFFSILEKIAPATRTPTMAERAYNFKFYLIFDILLAPIIAIPALYFLQKLTTETGGGLIHIDLYGMVKKFSGTSRIFASGILQLVPIFFYDFFFYWWHRWQHSSALLWEEHKLHHSDGNVNVTTTKRQHFLETPLTTLFISLPLAIFFSFTPVSAALTTVLIRLWQFFIHANLHLPLGGLTLVFCGPQYHRIHHSIEPQHINKNFAVWFPIWDVIFGTYYVPRRDEFPETGVNDTQVSPSLFDAFSAPFIAWHNIFQKKLQHSNKTNKSRESLLDNQDKDIEK